jgi:hypothetical protein
MSDDPQKLVGITRLAHEGRSDVRKFGGKASQKDERRRRGPEQLSRAGEQFPAVHPGHAEVANDECGRRFAHHAECRGAPGRGGRYVAGACSTSTTDSRLSSSSSTTKTHFATATPGAYTR